MKLINKSHKKYFLRLTTQDKIIFAKRLSVLITAGVPILSALRMLEKQASSKGSRFIFSSLAKAVERGESLSKSMGVFQKDFGNFSISIIHVGEISGSLQENLNYMAEELKKQQELKRKIISALVYPGFIVFATLCMAISLITYVFPKILPVFKSLRVPLPLTTRSLIFASNALINHGVLIFSSLFVIIFGVIFFSRRPAVKTLLHRNVLRVPFIGSLIMVYCMANFTRALGLLLQSDVKITQALNIVSLTTPNLTYQAQFKVFGENISRGGSLSMSLQKETKLFPALLWQMIEVGETTGNLSGSLIYLSQIYEDELSNLTKNLSTSIEPILMIVMGLLVGFIAISIIAPIYGITQNLHQ